MNSKQTEFLYQTQMDAGKHWSLRVRRGVLMQLSTLSESANVGMVLFNAENTLERYNAPDTLKCQHTFHLTQGNCLFSDMGRVMASVVQDSADGHESVCGNTDRAMIERLYGVRDYQQHRNDWYQNGHDAFLVELAKYGLDRRDLPSNINWFSKCRIGKDGAMSLLDGHAASGSRVALRFEMDCLVLMHTCPHPLSVAGSYPDNRVCIDLKQAEPLSDDDECLNHCDENRRGFRNNALYYLGAETTLSASVFTA